MSKYARNTIFKVSSFSSVLLTHAVSAAQDGVPGRRYVLVLNRQRSGSTSRLGRILPPECLPFRARCLTLQFLQYRPPSGLRLLARQCEYRIGVHHICSDPSVSSEAGAPSRVSVAFRRGDSGVAEILCERSVPGTNRPSGDVPNSAGREEWGAHRGFRRPRFSETAIHGHPR